MNTLVIDLGAADLDVPSGPCERIDEILASGPTVHVADNVWTSAVWRRFWR
jgi:hypothetical protein